MKNVMFLKIKWKGALYSNVIERVELKENGNVERRMKLKKSYYEN